MIDMYPSIIPKSDQLNSVDLMQGRTIDIKITAVDVKPKAESQKTTINYEGDNGKPWKPCKQMCWVLTGVWGFEGQKYIGQMLRLYRDDSVRFGSDITGGIRISHMSGITETKIVPIPVSRGIRGKWTVQPLSVAPSAEDWIADIMAVPTMDGLKHKYAEASRLFKDSKEFVKIHEAKEKRKAELS